VFDDVKGMGVAAAKFVMLLPEEVELVYDVNTKYIQLVVGNTRCWIGALLHCVLVELTSGVHGTRRKGG
jgi:hypothetical protein